MSVPGLYKCTVYGPLLYFLTIVRTVLASGDVAVTLYRIWIGFYVLLHHSE
jgi:hypothetical protein